MMGVRQPAWLEVLNRWDDHWYTHIYSTLDWAGVGQAPLAKWMDMPTTGLLICQTFGVVLQLFYVNEATTFFPLFTHPDDLPGHPIISIAHVNTDHFIMLKIADDAPMPHPNGAWATHVDEQDNPWLRLYRDRLQRGEMLHPSNTTGEKEWFDVPDDSV